MKPVITQEQIVTIRTWQRDSPLILLISLIYACFKWTACIRCYKFFHLLQLVSKSTVLLRPSDTRDMQYINDRYDQRVEDDSLQLDSVAVPEGSILFTR